MHSRVNELDHWQPVYSDSSMFVITSLIVKWRSFLKINEFSKVYQWHLLPQVFNKIIGERTHLIIK